MRLCLNTANRSPRFVPDPDLEAQVVAAARAGFELLGPDYENVRTFLAGGRSLADLRDILSDSGLRCLELTALHVRAEDAAAAEELDFITEVADALRPEAVVTILHRPAAVSVDLLRTAADRLAETGAVLALEFMAMSSVKTLRDAVDVAVACDHENVKLVLDTWHFANGGGTWAELEGLDPSLLAYVQISDSLPPESDDLIHETLDRRAMPGEGTFDWARFRRVLGGLGFDGGVSVEVLNADERAAADLGHFASRAYATAASFVRGEDY